MSKPACMHGIDRSLWVKHKENKTGRMFFSCIACNGFIGYIRRPKDKAKSGRPSLLIADQVFREIDSAQ